MSTTTPGPLDRMNRLYRTRWFMPAFCVLLAALIFAAFAIGGNTGDGALSAGVLVLLGAVFLFVARRPALLRGPPPLRDARGPRRPRPGRALGAHRRPGDRGGRRRPRDRDH